jgi:hypothetical protein
LIIKVFYVKLFFEKIYDKKICIIKLFVVTLQSEKRIIVEIFKLDETIKRIK